MLVDEDRPAFWRGKTAMDHKDSHETESRRSSPPANGWLVAVLLVLVGVLVFRMLDMVPTALHDPDAKARAITPRGNLAGDEQSRIELYKQAEPSVVHITNLRLVREKIDLDVMRIPAGTGTGFVWDDQGHVVTNYHVIKDAQEISVSFGPDLSSYAKVVGFAADKDLAVLKVDVPKSRLKPISIGTSADLQVGQNVLAIGNPFGLDRSLTTGVISGLGRQILSVTRRPIRGVIQTDAAINPGNSGGPMLDSAGRLIGVNTAIYSETGESSGVGFAVPVDTVNDIVPQLIRTGRVDRPGLGILLWEDDVVMQLVNERVYEVPGALILDVAEGSGAEKAGLRPSRRLPNGRIVYGDLIVLVDGRPVRSVQDLLNLLTDRKVGETVTLTIVRDGKQQEVDVKLQALES